MKNKCLRAKFGLPMRYIPPTDRHRRAEYHLLLATLEKSYKSIWLALLTHSSPKSIATAPVGR